MSSPQTGFPKERPDRPRTIVPPSNFVVHATTPIDGAPTPILTNHGGTVLQSVEVVPVYWGASWASGTNATLSTQLDGFFDFIVTSSVIDLLGEYSLPGKPIQHGKRLTSVRISNNEPGTGGNITDAQIQTALNGWIKAGTVPAVTANTLYFIYMPPNVTVTSGEGTSCGTFCGYHGAAGNAFYAVIPFVNCGGCQFSGAFLDTLTEVSSHEFCEAITDPALNTWWDPNTGNEIGDICNRQTVRLGNFLVQTEWSNEQNACAIAPVLARADSPIDGYPTTFNNQQHVNFIGADNHIHELYYSDEWHHNDLTALAKAPNAAAGSPLDGYQTTFNNQQHINFLGTDGHVHELVFTNAWSHNDLTADAGAPNAAANSPLDAYQTTFNNQQHVNFLGTDGHVHELFFTNRWAHNDLTALAKAPMAAAGGGLDGYQTTFNNQQHVNFVGVDGHVHELVFTNAWSHNDLTAITRAPAVSAGTHIDGYATEFNNQQHVNFIGADGHVHELVFTNAWSHNDLSAITGASNAAAGSKIDGYETTFNNQQHVNYVDVHGHVQELVFTNAWSHNDLTALTAAPRVAPGSPLDGYQTSFNNQQHVNFVAADRHVHELVFTNRWSHNDLTTQ